MKCLFFVIVLLGYFLLFCTITHGNGKVEHLAPVFEGEKLLSEHEVELPSQKTTILLALYYLKSQGGVRPAIFAKDKHLTSFYNFYRFEHSKPINTVVMDVDNDGKDDILLNQNGNFAVLHRWNDEFFPCEFFAAKEHHITRELRDIDGNSVYEVVETHERPGYNGNPIIEVYRLNVNYFVRDNRIPEQFRKASEAFLRQSYDRIKSVDAKELALLDEKSMDLKTLNFHYIYNKQPPDGRGKSIYGAEFEVRAQIERLSCGCDSALAVEAYRLAIPDVNICVNYFPGGTARDPNKSFPFVRGQNNELKELVSKIMLDEFNKFKANVLSVRKNNSAE